MDLTKQQIDFVKNMSDCLWIAFGGIFDEDHVAAAVCGCMTQGTYPGDYQLGYEYVINVFVNQLMKSFYPHPEDEEDDQMLNSNSIKEKALEMYRKINKIS